MYRIEAYRLTFDWPEGTGIRENMEELLQGCREAAQHSLTTSETIRVHIPNFADPGHIEARSNRSRVFPDPNPLMVQTNMLSQAPYFLIQAPEQSPYYNFSIPGLCQLLDADLLAIAPDLIRYVNQIVRTVFNYTETYFMAVPCPPQLISYTTMPRTLVNLTKRPRVPKLVDFTPIFISMFGEKIATVILKEIK